jgi:hypothetical protein
MFVAALAQSKRRKASPVPILLLCLHLLLIHALYRVLIRLVVLPLFVPTPTHAYNMSPYTYFEARKCWGWVWSNSDHNHQCHAWIH